ncbi:hypothetical protein RhiirA4_477396 [Rhizophagus irregularis]|uniref:Uncharacterized protein n=1 Tax=Rhizophagus irregularis TaxID=588596 RepID=A0A2I1HD98_9GLOM|nr:hypothetical protein RhiirA4_477396 [Rhizophagus irregularis]
MSKVHKTLIKLGIYSSVYCTPSLSFIANEIECCNDNSLNLATSKFCPMLRKLSTGIKNNELETLKIIFNSCKLESIKIWCGELESFFVNWTNCVPQKSLSLVIVIRDEENSLDKNYENIKIINKYTKLGVIKNFKVTDFDDDEYNI